MPTKYNDRVGVQVYTDGVCHWWGETETHDEVYLVSFNLSNEVFVKTSIPSSMDGIDSRPVFRHLSVLNGLIGWILNYEGTTILHISVLDKVGMKESWTKLFIVDPLFSVKHPIGVGKKGDIFFRKKDNQLARFNLITQKIVELGVKGDRCYCPIMVYFEESVLPIEGINS